MNFFQQVYEVVQQIPPGRVTTYGAIARMLGAPRASRAVGYALHANPSPGVIPCHRVVNRFGHLCEGFAFGGPDIQRQLLEAENVTVRSDDTIDLAEFGWNVPRKDG